MIPAEKVKNIIDKYNAKAATEWISNIVEKALRSAIANAENNHSLDIDKLIVKEAYVGKGLVMKRFHARARGRGARIIKPFSHLTILLSEQEGS